MDTDTLVVDRDDDVRGPCRRQSGSPLKLARGTFLSCCVLDDASKVQVAQHVQNSCAELEACRVCSAVEVWHWTVTENQLSYGRDTKRDGHAEIVPAAVRHPKLLTIYTVYVNIYRCK